MSDTLAAALLAELDDAALDALAERLAPRLAYRLGARSTDAPAAYTVSTLATELRVSTKTVRGAIHRGELSATRSGRSYYVLADAVRDWLDAREDPRSRRPSPARKARVRSPLRDALARLEE